MATLSDVRERIALSVRRNDTTVDYPMIDECIRSAIRMYQGKPMWFTRVVDTVTLTTGSSSVAMPSDYAGYPSFRILINGYYYSDGRGFDYHQNFDDFNSEFRSKLISTRPSACSVLDSTLYVDCLADNDYSIEVTYNKKDLTLPQSDGDTSVWFDDGVDAIRTQALAMYKDEDLEYEVSDKDWARAAYYLNELVKRNNQR